jgi:hypothetical protein
MHIISVLKLMPRHLAEAIIKKLFMGQEGVLVVFVIDARDTIAPITIVDGHVLALITDRIDVMTSNVASALIVIGIINVSGIRMVIFVI